MTAKAVPSSASRMFGCLWIALAATAASAFPSVLGLEREAVLAGELWRLWTGHLVHGSPDHLVYDAGAACLSLCAFGWPRRAGLLLLLAPPALSGALLMALPDLQFYYGLSGLLHGGFMAGTLQLFRQELRSRRPLAAALCGALCAGTLIKATFETWSGTAPFSGGLDLGGPTIHAAHLLGALLGGCAAWVTLRRPLKAGFR